MCFLNVFPRYILDSVLPSPVDAAKKHMGCDPMRLSLCGTSKLSANTPPALGKSRNAEMTMTHDKTSRLQDFKETNLTSLLGLTLRTSTSPSSSTTGFGLSACSDLSAAAAPARMWAPFSSGLARKCNDATCCLLVSWHSALSCSLHLFAFFSGEGRLRYN